MGNLTRVSSEEEPSQEDTPGYDHGLIDIKGIGSDECTDGNGSRDPARFVRANKW